MAAANANLVLVLGASGGIGGEIARQLRDAGWQVRGLKRGLSQSEEQRDGVAWLAGDAMNRDDMQRAAKGSATMAAFAAMVKR